MAWYWTGVLPDILMTMDFKVCRIDWRLKYMYTCFNYRLFSSFQAKHDQTDMVHLKITLRGVAAATRNEFNIWANRKFL